MIIPTPKDLPACCSAAAVVLAHLAYVREGMLWPERHRAVSLWDSISSVSRALTKAVESAVVPDTDAARAMVATVSADAEQLDQLGENVGMVVPRKTSLVLELTRFAGRLELAAEMLRERGVT